MTNFDCFVLIIVNIFCYACSLQAVVIIF